MTHNYVAFTIKSNNGVFSEIKIPMQVLTSDMECKARNIKAKVAPVIALWDRGNVILITMHKKTLTSILD